MALTQFSFGRVALQPDGIPALVNGTQTSETITPNGSTQSTTATAPASLGAGVRPFVRVATDTAVYVSFGSAPNAGTDTNRLYIPAGATEYVMVAASDKAAVITA